jgi:hypothetical protein
MVASVDVETEAVMGARAVAVNDVLDGHVALDTQCLDRILYRARTRHPSGELGFSPAPVIMP